MLPGAAVEEVQEKGESRHANDILTSVLTGNEQIERYMGAAGDLLQSIARSTESMEEAVRDLITEAKAIERFDVLQNLYARLLADTGAAREAIRTLEATVAKGGIAPAQQPTKGADAAEQRLDQLHCIAAEQSAPVRTAVTSTTTTPMREPSFEGWWYWPQAEEGLRILPDGQTLRWDEGCSLTQVTISGRFIDVMIDKSRMRGELADGCVRFDSGDQWVRSRS